MEEDLQFLADYTGQTLDELISMEPTHRVDSLVLAIESALDKKAERLGIGALSAQELTVLAIEALEREVSNGGYDQFFVNSSRVYAGEIEHSLRLIGCPEQAELAGSAVHALKIKGPVTADSVEAALTVGGDDLSEFLNTIDSKYYSCEEPIADLLFAFVKANRTKIRFDGG